MKNIVSLLLLSSAFFSFTNLNAQCTAAFTFYSGPVDYLPVDFIDQSTIPAGTSVTYSWDFAGNVAVSGTSNQQNPSHTFYGNNSGNTHTACLIISSATCTDTVCDFISFPIQPTLGNTVQLLKSSRQNNTITFDGTMDDGYGNHYTNWMSQHSSNPYAFNWDFGDGTVMNNTLNGNVSHQYTTPGTYTVTLNGGGTNYGYVINGTITDTVQINSIPTSIVEHNLENIQIFPSKVKEFIKIDLRSNHNEKFNFQVFDIQGKEVVKTTQIIGGKIESIDLSILKNQLYIIKLNSEKMSISRKIMKM